MYDEGGAESGWVTGDFSESEALFEKIFEQGKRAGNLVHKNYGFAEESVKKL